MTTKLKFLLLCVISFFFIGCNQKEKTMNLLCGDDYKLWYYVPSEGDEHYTPYFKYIDREGNFLSYDNSVLKTVLDLEDTAVIVYPNKWEWGEKTVLG